MQSCLLARFRARLKLERFVAKPNNLWRLRALCDTLKKILRKYLLVQTATESKAQF